MARVLPSWALVNKIFGAPGDMCDAVNMQLHSASVCDGLAALGAADSGRICVKLDIGDFCEDI